METIENILQKLVSQNMANTSNLPKTEKERMQYKVDIMNDSDGDLDKSIYDCSICKNKGLVFFVDERHGHYWEMSRECKCMNTRRSIAKMKKSGLEQIIKRSTFDKYETTEEWQCKVKEKSVSFVRNCEELEHKWFYIGGGVGSGKTHLCTAIVRELLLMGKSAKYMLWAKDSSKLKSIVNEQDYEPSLDEFRKAEVLYIDDFFKITKDSHGNELFPTAADIRLAYEIINYRYQHTDLITIISSERFIDEIEEIDSAVGSRIYEMAKGNTLNISRDKSRNYRMRNREVL